MFKRIYIFFLLLQTVVSAVANDGVFFVNGNHLVPVQETDIRLDREILTITLGDDGYADVDVYYELVNQREPKKVTMGFEAAAPYNDWEASFSHEGIHPYIADFSVVMNGDTLAWSNGVVRSVWQESSDFHPLDLEVWRHASEDSTLEDYASDVLFNRGLDSSTCFAYAYYFEAQFLSGRNIIHHTYSYRMSYGVGRTFEVPYWLRPAARWAGGVIGDFTLRICAPATAKHFALPDSVFRGSDFVIREGWGKTRRSRYYNDIYIEIALRNGTAEWHAANYRPAADFTLTSADLISRHSSEMPPVGTFYDRSDNYMPNPDIGSYSEWQKRIMRNLPYASRGYVFTNRKLRNYFQRLWWYMPDGQARPSMSEFTPREKRLIQEFK